MNVLRSIHHIVYENKNVESLTIFSLLSGVKKKGGRETKTTIKMRKFIYFGKTVIIGEHNAPVINRVQQPKEIIMTVQKDKEEIVFKLSTEQSKRLIKELSKLTAEANKFNKML